ncbi:MAG: ATP-binding cassette domain-containing protein [Betaproteobacteria bacterium]|nr:ATP-binding cassette domain-containing protein [Betaproteobacteria bacterium]
MSDTISAIEVSELTKQVTTGSTPLTILRDVSFRVAAGEAVAVVGMSGSGKSTLLALMAGLDTPSSGRVRIAGEDLFALDEDGRAALRGRSMGFVFQSFQLLASMTALENVLVPLELAGLNDGAEKAAALVQRVGLGERLRHYPKQLSGGEQQRVAIARAFVTSPSILLADEPTGNLDAATGAQIIDLLFELNRERNTTLVMVTHDESLSARCGRVIRLSGGMLQA